MIRSIDTSQLSHPELHRLMLGAIAPRPIAFASTVDASGRPNLAPFSFFNAFGVNPSTIIFSPSRRGRDNTTKDTFNNLKEVPEVVINAVNYGMVEQVSLASTEFPAGINEFEKSGFTPLASVKVRPFRVAESPVQWECRVREIIETGTGGGAANLVICEVLMVHISESALTPDGQIDTTKLDLVGRMGGDYYVRASGHALFEVEKPLQKPAIGIDSLPVAVKNSKILTGNELGRLGSSESIPSETELVTISQMDEVVAIHGKYADSMQRAEQIQLLIRDLLKKNRKREALCVAYLL
ncbi:MAG: flavin reductase family protein [Lentimicrobium sp.]|nr:flavin reductase family protein [Lentimicrobium sp.]